MIEKLSSNSHKGFSEGLDYARLIIDEMHELYRPRRKSHYKAHRYIDLYYFGSNNYRRMHHKPMYRKLDRRCMYRKTERKERWYGL